MESNSASKKTITTKAKNTKASGTSGAMPHEVIMEANDLSQPIEEEPTVVTNSFFRQQIDMGIHDIMYQVSQEIADIVKPVVHKEAQQAKEQEQRCAAQVSSAMSIGVLGQPQGGKLSQMRSVQQAPL